MKIAFNKQKETVDIDFAEKGDYYSCIHCGSVMIPAALESHKVSPYFRTKNTHEDDCAVKNINTRVRYNSKDTEVEDIYKKLGELKLKSTDSKGTIDSTPERTKKERKYIKIRFLNQLVEFCLSNGVDEFLGNKEIKDFFVDKRTYKSFSKFKEGNLYLFATKFRRYDDENITITATFPIGIPQNEISIHFFDKKVYTKIRKHIFNKDDKGNYKEMYILAKISKTNELNIYYESQFFFVPKKEVIYDDFEE